ncbi:MAG: serine/threonine-protein kinase [Thermoanaerobaculia bacterium]
MRTKLWPQVDRLLAQALELPADERTALVEEACDGNTELRREVVDLLAADDHAGSFLERPAVEPDPEADTGDQAPLETDERVGPYRLDRVLGWGGMGTVYLARREDRQYRRQVAIKVLRRDGRSPELLDRFRAERQILAGLEHPNIARLYDGGATADGRPYLVMELVDGLPIDLYCDRGRLSIDRRLRLFQDVCAAVEYAHRSLLVHRDLKPANILVTTDGAPKLLDFGIAKLLGSGRIDLTVQPTRTGLRPMTPSYASPEQIRGGAITTASDTYALGVLLYRLLTGRSPYPLQQDLPHELERAILEHQAERASDAVERVTDRTERTPEAIAKARESTPQELRRRLRGDLDNILAKALRKQPQRRYGSARELAEDLERHLGDRPVTARPDSLRYRLSKFVRRHTLGIAAGATVVALLLSFSVVTALQSGRIREERDTARQERAKAEQVTRLLTGLFESADPFGPAGDDLSVREVLDRSAEKIAELEGQPLLQATFMSTVGGVYLELGLSAEAAPLIETALALRRAAHGEEHLEVAESLHLLAVLRGNQGDFESAEALHRQTLAMRRKLLGDPHQAVAESLNFLGLAVYSRGDYQGAEAFFRETLAMRRPMFGDRSFEVGQSLNNLALALHARGDYEAAEPLYRESLQVWRRVFGDGHPEVALSMQNLAGLLQDLEDYEAAETLARDSLDIARRQLGDDHPRVIITLYNLADLLYEKGDYQASESFSLEALTLGRRTFGPDHPRVAHALSGFARLRLATGDVQEAERLSREALAIYRAKLPAGHWRTARIESVLGAALTARRQYQEAEPLLVAAYPVIRSQIGDREPMTRDALSFIIDHYQQRGMTAAADEYRSRQSGG